MDDGPSVTRRPDQWARIDRAAPQALVLLKGGAHRSPKPVSVVIPRSIAEPDHHDQGTWRLGLHHSGMVAAMAALEDVKASYGVMIFPLMDG
jgi:hypothetical protein